jgi:WD40 repeat protein
MAWAVTGAVRLWDLTTEQETPRLDLFRQGVHWAGFSADGRLLRAGGANGELGVWNAATGRRHGPLHKTPLTQGARYMPATDRGRVVVVTSGNDFFVPKPQLGEGRIFLWDPPGDGDPVPLREQAEPVGNAALTPDNRFIAGIEAAGRIRVYDAAAGKPIRSFEGRKIEYRPTFSPNGVLLATIIADGTIRLYDFATGRLLRELKGQSHAGCLAFSPDGRILVSGHFTSAKESVRVGDAIYLWDTASGRELQRIPAKHGGGVQALSFSPDGRLLASCGLDGAVLLWEAASGQERRRYAGHRRWALSVDFAPDGDRFASASLDGTAVVWQVFGPASAERPAADSAALWADLARDGLTAHRAMASLIAAPRQAVPLLRERLRPVASADPQQVARLIAELDSDRFAVRENATRELERLGELAEPLLRKAREGAPSLEFRRRLDQLLERLQGPVVSPERLRDLRAVEVLEHLGGTEARRLLRKLAKGAGAARLTREAKASLARLERTGGKEDD